MMKKEAPQKGMTLEFHDAFAKFLESFLVLSIHRSGLDK